MTEQEKKIEELEEKVLTLEEENTQLKEDVEKLKPLAEENTELKAALDKAKKGIPAEEKDKKFVLSSEITVADGEPESDE